MHLREIALVKLVILHCARDVVRLVMRKKGWIHVNMCEVDVDCV